ncbi:hypothetical protein SAMN05216362_11865 [Piscibacillus halophilus]|uniref:Uncharacterized protein n=1 Tax=Piscibacillus halophilus TaxID=571933 RepID=A0A1H9HC04_9BACI|nr:hypothetical protein SAMN05216362_11865 [Piscibacillus halophilus]
MDYLVEGYRRSIKKKWTKETTMGLFKQLKVEWIN